MLVKKYGNRRLYDTEDSRYITLEELADKVRAGADARVVDARTGEDLTQVTLTQIILESRGAARLLPVPLLLQLIRLGDEALAEFLGRYMSATLELYLQARQGAQQVSQYNPLALLPFTSTSTLARLLGGLTGWTGGTPPPAPPPPASAAPPPPPAPAAAPAAAAVTPASSSDVAALREELEELKRSLRRRRR
jgi:polyhydroxyalkanoate synthesis repressor PhaR